MCFQITIKVMKILKVNNQELRSTSITVVVKETMLELNFSPGSNLRD